MKISLEIQIKRKFNEKKLLSITNEFGLTEYFVNDKPVDYWNIERNNQGDMFLSIIKNGKEKVYISKNIIKQPCKKQ
jgi:hypothetical protein